MSDVQAEGAIGNSTVWDEQTWEQVEHAVARLEDSWRTAGDADLTALVPPPNNPWREAVLTTLVKVDLENHWKRRSPRRVEDYLRDWPELSDDPATIVDLLLAECRVRRGHPDPPTPEELTARFPSLEDRFDHAFCSQTDASSDAVPSAAAGSASLFDSILSHATAGTGSDDDSPALSPGSLLAHRYRVIRVLGSGGMGTVYLAKDEELDRTVAVKLLHRWVCDVLGGDRLRDEARKAARPKHPIVPIYDVVPLDNGEFFLVMEYVEGESLEDVLASGTVDPAFAVEIALQLADALHLAHQEGLVHRDVKPANILLDGKGHLRLTDFGLAVHGHELATRSGEGSGTLPYMAPEQLRGENLPCDRRTDIWAAGAVFYEMLTGRRPFEAASRDELATAILEAEPVPPRSIRPGVPRGLQRICLKCLRKAIDRRYPSAAELAADLRTWRLAASRPFLSRTVGVMTLIVTAVLLACAAFVVLGMRRDWDPQTIPREPREPATWLNDCKLIFIAETGARINFPGTQQYVRGYCSKLLPRELLTFHPSRAEDIGESLQILDGWLCWEMPLSIAWIENEKDSQLGPLDYGVRLRVAVGADGCFQLGTIGDRPDEHLLVLAMRGGIRNYCDFGGAMLPADAFDVPHNFQLDSDERQNQLAAWFADIYKRFRDRGLSIGGPPREADLYLCPVRLHNRFDRPITVVQARIYHQQFDYEWYPEDFRKVEEAMNARWSPIAERPDWEADLVFSFEMKSDPSQPSALFVRATSDNDNTTAFRIDGLSNVGSPPHEFQGNSSSITLDREAGVCRGANEGSCSAYAILYGQSPSKVELTAHTTWSVVQPAFRYATLGDVEIANGESTAAGADLQRIQPQVWQIPPDSSLEETTRAKSSSSHPER